MSHLFVHIGELRLAGYTRSARRIEAAVRAELARLASQVDTAQWRSARVDEMALTLPGNHQRLAPEELGTLVAQTLWADLWERR